MDGKIDQWSNQKPVRDPCIYIDTEFMKSCTAEQCRKKYLHNKFIWPLLIS